MAEIICALIAAVVAVITQAMINSAARKREDVSNEVRQQRLDDRLAVIERKLDEHNGYANKLGDIAVRLAKIETDIAYIKGR